MLAGTEGLSEKPEAARARLAVAVWRNKGLQKGEGKDRVKNSTPRTLTQMQKTDLNKKY